MFSGQNKLLVERYMNSNWAEDKDNQKSTSNFIFMVNGGPIS